jgi:16S rRNA G527 N7-methylase RsmG
MPNPTATDNLERYARQLDTVLVRALGRLRRLEERTAALEKCEALRSHEQVMREAEEVMDEILREREARKAYDAWQRIDRRLQQYIVDRVRLFDQAPKGYCR